jgi:BlaI family penicillinase repressor
MAGHDTNTPFETPEVSKAELRVLQSLWDQGPSTIRQLTERLYSSVTPAIYSTVQKLLERLEKDRYAT